MAWRAAPARWNGMGGKGGVHSRAMRGVGVMRKAACAVRRAKKKTARADWRAKKDGVRRQAGKKEDGLRRLVRPPQGRSFWVCPRFWVVRGEQPWGRALVRGSPRTRDETHSRRDIPPEPWAVC